MHADEIALYSFKRSSELAQNFIPLKIVRTCEKHSPGGFGSPDDCQTFRSVNLDNSMTGKLL